MDLPLLASRFHLEIAGRVVPVSQVSGLSYAPEEKPPATVTLRRAAGADSTLLDWARKPVERAVRVSLLDSRGETAVSYVLSGARPVAWHGPDLAATSPDLAFEGLVLAAERVELG